MEGRWIDVREYPEFAGGHIESSELIPLGTLGRASEAWDRTTPLTLVCRTGRRAEDARQILERKGFTSLQVLEGGVQAWTNSGKPLTAACNQPWAMGAPGTRHRRCPRAHLLRSRPACIEEVLRGRRSRRCGPRLCGCKQYLHDGIRAWPHALECPAEICSRLAQ